MLENPTFSSMYRILSTYSAPTMHSAKLARSSLTLCVKSAVVTRSDKQIFPFGLNALYVSLNTCSLSKDRLTPQFDIIALIELSSIVSSQLPLI